MKHNAEIKTFDEVFGVPSGDTPEHGLCDTLARAAYWLARASNYAGDVSENHKGRLAFLHDIAMDELIFQKKQHGFLHE